MPSVHQIIVAASSRDAITNMALQLRSGLQTRFESEVFSFFPPEETVGECVKHLSELPLGTSNDVLVYHSSFGIRELTTELLHRPERIVIVYHNITPARYYEDSEPLFAAQLAWGRTELEMIRHKVVLSFADSQFNARDLEEYGYSDVTVIPAGVNPRRLDIFPTDQEFLGDLNTHFPDGFILFVSQVLQHKRVELALEAIHLIRSVWRLNIGLVVAGPMRKPNYSRDLELLRHRLPESHVLFTGEISETHLATLYRACSVFISTSDHEGLSIPPLEAMAAGAPVVVRAAGAVAETVKDAGVVLPLSCDVGEFAGAVVRVIQDNALRISLIQNGYQRIKEFEDADMVSLFVEHIGKLFV
jgi:glycosyltransferase involved in cell wall biosynthesis